MTTVLALNPAIDAEWRVGDVLWEEKNIVHAQRRWAGGKGVNVARWLKFLGADPALLIPLGGDPGRELLSQLHAEHLRVRVVPLRGDTRVNVIVTTARGRQMRFNPAGPRLAAKDWRAVIAEMRRSSVPIGNLMVLSGSLPPGAPADAYAQLNRLARRLGARALLDCDGPAFAAAVKEQPFLVKPNVHELSQWRGKPLRGERIVLRAARELSEATAHWALVSLGADGALLVNVRENFAARARVKGFTARPLTTVGAGDALLAAVAAQVARGTAPEEWLRHGVATGTAATQFDGGCFPKRALLTRLLRAVEVRPVPTA